MKTEDIWIGLLASHLEIQGVVGSWLEAEWPDWYGPGGEGDIEADLAAYSQPDSLPVGLIAFAGETPCGFMALKSDPIAEHEDCSPWVGAGFVVPHLRGRGIGGRLLEASEVEAKKRGHAQLYCGTVRAETLLQRSGWRQLSTACHDGEAVHQGEERRGRAHDLTSFSQE